jgi:hypothetical protein
MTSDSQTWYGSAVFPPLARHGSTRAWASYHPSNADRKAAGFTGGADFATLRFEIEEGIVRGMSLRLLSDAMPRVTGKVFSRKYIMLGRLVTHWKEIVGQDLADRAQPVKIHYRKVPGSKVAEATLEIASSTAEATLLHYRKELILERINQIFGERVVTALRFVPQAANEVRTGKARTVKKPVTSKDRAELANILESIDDPELKERLERLGTSILQER